MTYERCGQCLEMAQMVPVFDNDGFEVDMVTECCGAHAVPYDQEDDDYELDRDLGLDTDIDY